MNKGLPAARNLAIQLASGDFIFHVDADDFIEKDAISSLVSEQLATNADLVVANHVIETQYNTIQQRYCDISKTKDEIVKECIGDKGCQSVCGILIKRSIYLDNDLKADESFSIGEDWQVSPLLLYYAQKIAYVDKGVYHYQLSRPTSITLSSQTSFPEKKKRFICYVKTMNRLLDSFKDKGDTYLSAIYREKAILTQDAMIYACRDRDKTSFHEMLSEQKSIDPKYLSALGKSNPVVSALKRNYYALLSLLWMKDFFNGGK
ncbi:MAG: glycosyltransferase [Alloprevotella sp.]|nr:glycosyltransferase [Prevotella sp.]MBR1712898.1 glycosyltransferase [Alloprevotella sp.]